MFIFLYVLHIMITSLQVDSYILQLYSWSSQFFELK